jgi:hypothetical protein
MRRTVFLAAAAATLLAAAPASADRVFTPSATELPGDAVRLPLLHGVSDGRPVSFVVTEASDGEVADRYGVAVAQKLENARGTDAVQRVAVIDGVIHFPATVDFRPERRVTPGPSGFPPLLASPGAVGEAGYSPLVELPDGTIVNAPHVANATGRADKVLALDGDAVVLRETNGFARDRAVRYVSYEASDPAVAALEDATYAPALAAAPAAGDDGSDSARASLAAIVNGPTGAANPERQGLSSALLDGLDPLNVLRWLPNQGRYSPLWDVHAAAWSAQPRRIRDWSDAEDLAGDGRLALGPIDVIVNCPIVSQST